MRTYAESKGKKPFDWNEFLSRDKYTEEEWKAAMKLSYSWITCACGNQCDIIPRRESGAPEDCKLWELGDRFSTALENEEIYEAVRLLNRIEKRSADIIENIKNESFEE